MEIKFKVEAELVFDFLFPWLITRSMFEQFNFFLLQIGFHSTQFHFCVMIVRKSSLFLNLLSNLNCVAKSSPLGNFFCTARGKKKKRRKLVASRECVCIEEKILVENPEVQFSLWFQIKTFSLFWASDFATTKAEFSYQEKFTWMMGNLGGEKTFRHKAWMFHLQTSTFSSRLVSGVTKEIDESTAPSQTRHSPQKGAIVIACLATLCAALAALQFQVIFSFQFEIPSLQLRMQIVFWLTFVKIGKIMFCPQSKTFPVWLGLNGPKFSSRSLLLKIEQTLFGVECRQQRIQVGLGARVPLAPQDFFKIMQFSGNFKGKPLFWANVELSASLGSKLCWAPPWPKSWIRAWQDSEMMQTGKATDIRSAHNPRYGVSKTQNIFCISPFFFASLKCSCMIWSKTKTTCFCARKYFANKH